METTNEPQAVSLGSRYEALGIPLREVERFLGKPLAAADNAEYTYLTKLVSEIERGRAVWSEVLEYKLTADLEKDAA